ncbi:hypothetical protein [Sinorhizobium meliloti]|uniref:hypothetical protein n=1 Tax=Rhizobium meliloti TaxID=382 RepID=UPI00059B04BE|nr:hypothetical protein [Sinorhizobium meliloti]ASP79340.1 hypothetical protein CDO27_16030 [Sinorhizobium meliloti]MQW20848.1 hypothetical protein [Sinorhizobium meliloti]
MSEVQSNVVAINATHAMQAAETVLKGGDGGGTLGEMSVADLHSRLSKLEGGWSVFQWSVATVSALMVGAMAVIVAVQLFTQAQVGALGDKVEALPDRINQNLMELSRTLSSAIAASKDNSQPTVIYVPTQLPPAPPQPAPPSPQQQ